MALDFLCKVESVPRSIIRETGFHFRKGASPAEVMKAIGNTRKVVLSALYAEALRRTGAPLRSIKELVKATGVSSVKRVDLVARVLELSAVGVCATLTFCTALTSGKVGDKEGREEDECLPIKSGDDEEVILCQDVLSQVRSDMKLTILPSEISPVPREVGSPSAGKLTADQWRSFCTIHLVVSLIRLWGKERQDSHQSRILNNFLHLITLTNLLHMRTLTRERIQRIEDENLAYLEGLRTLYPHSSLVPKHHMALHLPAMLRDFGPVHAWRTFAFERLNQIFQNISTNNAIGKLERHHS